MKKLILIQVANIIEGWFGWILYFFLPKKQNRPKKIFGSIYRIRILTSF